LPPWSLRITSADKGAAKHSHAASASRKRTIEFRSLSGGRAQEKFCRRLAAAARPTEVRRVCLVVGDHHFVVIDILDNQIDMVAAVPRAGPAGRAYVARALFADRHDGPAALLQHALDENGLERVGHIDPGFLARNADG